jgi:hypothetical protein
MTAYLAALKELGLPPTDPNTAIALGGTLVTEAPQTAQQSLLSHPHP